MRLFRFIHRPLPHLARLMPLLLFVLGASLAHAQATPAIDGGDPPDRVARLSYLAGDVGFLPAGADDWSDADINRPLTGGDRLASGSDARAELELDTASLRIAAATDVGLLQLDDRVAQWEITRGSLNLSVRRLDADQSYEIDTPTVALVISQPGVFRVDVDDSDGSTRVTALDGQAIVYGENNASRVIVGGHSYRFNDSALSMVVEQYAGGGDGFDQWCAERDRRYAQSQTRQYVSDDVIGYQDLDDYGQWQVDDEYGEVWYPASVGSTWAPYSAGHWAYVAPWGWTWVDDAPWGFAPYHYGRWASVRGRWGWIPGPRELRPIYAPALVAFVGGGGWNAAVGVAGPIGWFPLGPGDIYNPWYAVSQGYYRRVNQHNLRGGRRHGDRDHDVARIDEHYRHYYDGRPNPDDHYANRHAPHGITAVSRDAFVHARRVQHHGAPMDAKAWNAAPVLARGTDLRPVRGSLAADRAGHGRPAPVGDFTRSVMAHREPSHGVRTDHASMADARGSNRNVHVLGDTRRQPARPPVDAQAVQANPIASRLGASRAAEEHRSQSRRRDTSPAEASGTLPTVQRVMSARSITPASSPVYQAYRPPRTDARPAQLPTPARIESARAVSPGDRREREARQEVSVVHAPAASRRAVDMSRRYGAVAEPQRQPMARPPAARIHYAPAPQQRRFDPPPQARAPMRSNPAPPHHESATPASPKRASQASNEDRPGHPHHR